VSLHRYLKYIICSTDSLKVVHTLIPISKKSDLHAHPKIVEHQSYDVKYGRLQLLFCLYDFPGTPWVHPSFQKTSSQDFTRVALTSQRYRIRATVNKANMIPTAQMTSQHEPAGSRHPKSTAAHDMHHSLHRVHLPQRVWHEFWQAFPRVFIAYGATAFCRKRTAQSALVRNWREAKVTVGSNERGGYVFIPRGWRTLVFHGRLYPAPGFGAALQ
jgi:hypothetical protein